MKKFTYTPPQTPLVILHQDADLIVINKPAGLLSNPGIAEETHDCALTRLQQQFPDVILIHRLDCETSGILVFARHKKAEVHLKKQFENRSTAKVYLAQVQGCPKHLTGTIDLPLAKDKDHVPLQKVCLTTGKPSVTHYKVLHTNGKESLVELTPLTGRTHQLRVHLHAINCPILGDNFYGDDTVVNARPRLCLHAMSLTFNHPTSLTSVTFHQPADFPI